MNYVSGNCLFSEGARKVFQDKNTRIPCVESIGLMHAATKEAVETLVK